MVAMVAVVAGLALSFIAVIRLIGTAIMHRTVRQAVDKDPAAAETLIAQLGRPTERTGDDRLATILIAVGVAMIGAALVAIDDPGPIRAAIGAALFPLVVGSALWLRLYLLARARRGTGQ
jgi:hypothetical protein